MKSMKIFFLLIVFLLPVIFSCAGGIQSATYCKPVVYIPEWLGIENGELEAVFENSCCKCAEKKNPEIVVYNYSPGKEVFSLSDNLPGVSRVALTGTIEVLVKIRHNEELSEVYFLSSRGSSKDDLLKKIVLEINRALCD